MRRHLVNVWANQQGIILVVTLMLMGLLTALAAAYGTMIRSDTILRGAAGRERNGFYAAEAGLNVAMAATRNQFDNFQTPSGITSGSVVVGSGSAQRTVNYVLSPVNSCQPCPTQPIPTGKQFAGLNSIPYQYTLSSTETNAAGDQEAMLGAEFTVHNIPIFQFLAFSVPNLFIMPAPDMNLHGRIHTNGNLYLNVNDGANLTIGDRQPQMPFVQVSAVGQIYRGGTKDYTGPICTGKVTIDRNADLVAPTPDLDPVTLGCAGSGPAVVPATTIANYLGSVSPGVRNIQVPTLDTIQRGSGTFWQSSDLRLVLNLTATKLSAFCSATLISPGLFPIEVQDSAGNRDMTKTTSLWQFMCERRGAIFYNEIPTGAVDGTPNDTLASDPTKYKPQFAHANKVYRRVGEDTNGDGIVDSNATGGATNSDRNYDTCPVYTNSASIPARPFWVPDDCDSFFLGGTGGTPVAWNQRYWGAPTNPRFPTAQQTSSSSWFSDNDYRRGGFYNRREGRWITMLSVNIRALIDWNEAKGFPLFPTSNATSGGLVFFLTVQGSESNSANNHYGVRIFDSADLNTRGSTFPYPLPADPTGLTVVSDQGMYIEGNYNSKDWYPAAVIADTINVLSQGWEVPSATSIGGVKVANDRKSVSPSNDTGLGTTRVVPDSDGNTSGSCPNGGCTSFTTATALNLNAALISGIADYVGNNTIYNGGLENYLRFHESWTDRTLNYLGSFVTLGYPRHQTNGWACGSGDPCYIYDPPNRNWDYDTKFNTVANLPPLTPKFTYIQQDLYTRFYK